MLESLDLASALPLLRRLLEGRVRLAILFGSQATGRTHTASDVDIGVWPHS